jgi:hypothetical protein
VPPARRAGIGPGAAFEAGAVGGRGSGRAREEGANLFDELAALGGRKFAFEGRLGARGEVVAPHIALDAPERGDDGTDLMGDVDAVPLVLDHLLEPAQLPLDAPQARELLGMINRLAAAAGGPGLSLWPATTPVKRARRSAAHRGHGRLGGCWSPAARRGEFECGGGE